MKQFFHTRKALLTFSMMALAGFQTGFSGEDDAAIADKRSQFHSGCKSTLQVVRGTICVRQNTNLPNSVDFEIQDGRCFSLGSNTVQTAIRDITAEFVALGKIVPGAVAKEVSFQIDIEFNCPLATRPSVTLTPQNETPGSSSVVKNPMNPNQFATVSSTVFALRGNATASGFTASVVLTLEGTDEAWVDITIAGLLKNPFLDRFCLHFQALAD